MQTGFVKGLKPILIKRLGMLMGIFYLLNPLHHQLNDILHAISHGIEMPDSVIDHSWIGKSDQHIHEYHEHESPKENHEHLLIHVIDLVFRASHDHDGSNESLITQLKIDKHITISCYQKMMVFSMQVEHRFLNPSQKIKVGHLRTQGKPPENFLN